MECSKRHMPKMHRGWLQQCSEDSKPQSAPQMTAGSSPSSLTLHVCAPDTCLTTFTREKCSNKPMGFSLKRSMHSTLPVSPQEKVLGWSWIQTATAIVSPEKRLPLTPCPALHFFRNLWFLGPFFSCAIWHTLSDSIPPGLGEQGAGKACAPREAVDLEGSHLSPSETRARVTR